jgi:F420-dependent oxidoreductase-like protein
MFNRKQLSFGIKTAPQHTTYQDILRVWEEADELPLIEHAWLFDHFMPLGDDPTGPCLEGWTLLAALAARTKRVRVGLMVTGNTYRHPAVLANEAVTVDIISNGRLDFGIGAGWNELEHTAYGIPLYEPGERIRRMGEACELIRLLWTEKRATFNGRYYQLKDAMCEPKPVQKPYPPIVIGGGGEKLTLRMVARYADIWNFIGNGPEDFKHKSEVLDQHCHDVHRDPLAIERSVQVMVHPDNLDRTITAVQSFIDVGATHLILNLRHPYPVSICARLVKEVIEPLKKRNEPLKMNA